MRKNNNVVVKRDVRMQDREIAERIWSRWTVSIRAICFRFATGIFALALTAHSASAQTPGRVAVEDSGYLQWVVFLGLAVVVCATGFLNPKRSHLN